MKNLPDSCCGSRSAQLEKLLEPVAYVPALGLAVSGGTDSLGMLLLVHDWQSRAPTDRPELFVYSVDHRLREASAGECAEVARVSAKLKLAHRTLCWEGEKPESGIQEAARKNRYRLIGQAMAKDGVSILLTAHHRNDQAETILMRMAHGSGIGGLAGMRTFSQIEGVRVFRPFVNTPPEQLASRVEQSGLTGAADSSNADMAYERTRWRKVMAQFSSAGLTADRLVRLGHRLERGERALEQVARKSFAQIVTLDHFGVAGAEFSALFVLALEIRMRVLEQMIYRVTGSRKPVGLAALERLAAEIFAANEENGKNRSGFSGRTLGGAQVVRFGQRLVVFAEAGRTREPDRTLAVERETVWKQRFVIRNRGNDQVQIRSGVKISRAGFCRISGENFPAPMSALRAVPFVLDRSNIILGIGGRSFCPDLDCELAPELVEPYQNR